LEQHYNKIRNYVLPKTLKPEIANGFESKKRFINATLLSISQGAKMIVKPSLFRDLVMGIIDKVDFFDKLGYTDL
jgi:hypothetical protein